MLLGTLEKKFHKLGRIFCQSKFKSSSKRLSVWNKNILIVEVAVYGVMNQKYVAL